MSKRVSSNRQNNKLVKFINESHIYPSLYETVVKTLLLAFTAGASILCYLNEAQESKVIGGAVLLYVLSVMSEIVPKIKNLTNLLNRIYILAIFIWSFAMLLECGNIIFGEDIKITLNSLFIFLSLIPNMIYVVDAVIYFLFGNDEIYDDLGYMPAEAYFREMRNI